MADETTENEPQKDEVSIALPVELAALESHEGPVLGEGVPKSISR
jgi:hypothetical protein